MKVVALVSGGKDSCFAMMRCLDYGHQIVALANLIPLDDSVDELDSYMYQTVGHQIILSYAECMGLPLFRRRIRGSSREQKLNYTMTKGDEVEDMYALLYEIKKQIPSINAVSTGAIASDYQRLRVESVCSRLGLVSLSYLWKQDQTTLLQEMIRRGIVAITVKVAAMGLNPEKHLGRELSDLMPHLLQLKEKYGINVCGEGGEYETLTLDCPLFNKARIILDKYQVKLHSPDSIAPVGILHPLSFHIEHKFNSKNDENDLDKPISNLFEVEGDPVSGDVASSEPSNLKINDIQTVKRTNLCVSKTGQNLFSIGCWIHNPSSSSEGLQEDLSAVLSEIKSRLSEYGFSWANVLYIHLYISNMKQFALANEAYVKFITENECKLGVPSRSTIELPLTECGFGNAFVEVLVAREMVKRVLHVQSISCWAPSCIGPYSQATLYKGVLYMAGQLGLDPRTMNLCSAGPTAELEQALKNTEAVANCFNSSIHSSFLLTVYCSSKLTQTERTQVQQTIESSFDSRSMTHGPAFLYILAPDLPKGASVEVKPVLYIPDGEEEKEQVQTKELEMESQSDKRGSKDCIFDSISRIHTVNGKICSAVVSIIKGTDKTNMKEIARFCVVLLDKILSESDFSWENLVVLRIYYPTNLSTDSDTMSIGFSEALSEFVKGGEECMSRGNEPIYNLVPVLGSGQSASVDDFITCELFASKV